ncbi:hypothetical protein EZV62_001261 [Acer yangbiense]|uniref:DUF4283 domain-containing protein n=1 Tax=Acer yangbiense TaxID=1000413 RepID=A0A5C7IVZ1_9ROSI|nr:hypothetical protein EZV62_001261 [Acer yangbiense]
MSCSILDADCQIEDLSLEMEIGATNFSEADCWATPLSLAKQIVDKAEMEERGRLSREEQLFMEVQILFDGAFFSWILMRSPGKILSKKHVNREAFRTVIPRIWQTNLDIEVVQDNIFLFYFRNQSERFRVLTGEPWSFDNCLLVLEKRFGVGEVTSLAFNHVAVWIQVINTPLLCMTKEMEEFVGQLIGVLVDMDVGLQVSALDDDRCEVGSDFDFGPWLRASSPPGQHKSNGHYRFRGDNSGTGGGSQFFLPSVSLNPNHAYHNWRAILGGSGEDNLGLLNGRSVSKNDDQLVVGEMRLVEDKVGEGVNDEEPLLEGKIDRPLSSKKEVAKGNEIIMDMEHAMHATTVDVKMNEETDKEGRNQVVHNKGIADASEVYGWFESFIKDFRPSSINVVPSVSGSQVIPRWQAPKRDKVYKEWDGGDIISNGDVEADEGIWTRWSVDGDILKGRVYGVRENTTTNAEDNPSNGRLDLNLGDLL